MMQLSIMKANGLFYLALTAFLIKSIVSLRYSMHTSMQSTSQTLILNLPYIQTCNYTSPVISPGLINIQEATPINLYNYFLQNQLVSFWGSFVNGYDIYLGKQQIMKGYDGMVYKPSVFNVNSDQQANDTTDMVTMFKVYTNGTLTLYDIEVYVNQINNFTLDLTVIDQSTPQFTNQTIQLIQNCISNGSSIRINQLDQTHYLGCCLNTSLFFFFSLSPSYVSQILDLSTYNISILINRIILNPTISQFGISQSFWNVLILGNNQTQLHSCEFNPLEINNFTCLNQTQLEKQFTALLSQIWSEQQFIEETKLQKLLGMFSYQLDANFPGFINSIFVDKNDNIYVQSLLNNNTYLNLFNWNKQLILNISFQGDIVIYNQLQFLIYSNVEQSYIIMNLDLPLLILNLSDINANNTFSLQLQCKLVDNIIIQYQIFLTSIQYPSSVAYQLQPLVLSSSLNIYTFKLEQYFKIFGPGYTVYFKGPQQLQATSLDASILSSNQYVLSVINILVQIIINRSIFMISKLFYTTNNGVYAYHAKSKQHVKIGLDICGIHQQYKGITINNKETLIYGYDSNDQIVYCMCPASLNNLNQCYKTNEQGVRNKIHQNKQKISQKIQKLQKISLIKTTYDQVSDCSSCVKQRIFTLVFKGLMVTIFHNNTAILSNIWSGQFLSMINVSCSKSSQLFGSIYRKQLFQPILYLLCQQSSYMGQFIIRSNQIFFQRFVPLYGFFTRSATTSIISGNTYLFVEVQLDQASDITINIDPKDDNCCVLRIDPYRDTVSAIVEVIFARNIQSVFKFNGIDVAYYTGTSITSDFSYLKIYLGETWLAINRTVQGTEMQSYPFNIVFNSVNYNFAIQFPVIISYNLSKAQYQISSNPLAQTIFLQQYSSLIHPIIYKQIINFTYNNINGPILGCNISEDQAYEMIQDVQLSQMITKSKVIGRVGSKYLQIFTPMNGNSLTSLDGVILAIDALSIQVFLKNYNNLNLYSLKVIYLSPNMQNCKYYSYKRVNDTSLTFVSQCYVPLFEDKSPILTLNLYLPSNQLPILTYTLVIQKIDNILTNIETITLKNVSLVLGIQEGPMQSLTGKLKYCFLQTCSCLYISSKQNFLLDFNVFVYPSDKFLIVALDLSNLRIWLNPAMPSSTSIPPSYTLNLNNYITDTCSRITIFKATDQYFNAILSAATGYYEVVYYYGGDLQILGFYQRYINCQQYDKFKVEVVLQDGILQGLVAECKQNQDMLRLQMYQTINSSSILIYTGYLMYFTKAGPISKNQFSNPNYPSYNPVKLIQLSTSMVYQMFLVYRTQQGKIKLLYQQINGMLIDNQLSLQPSLSITLSPLTTQINFPSLSLYIFNDFSSLNFIIKTNKQPLSSLTTVELVFLIIFVLCNIITLVFIIIVAITGRKQTTKTQLLRTEAQEDYGFKDFKEKFRNRLNTIQNFIRLPRLPTYMTLDPRDSQDARKLTEIQLFMMRNQAQNKNQSKGKE